MDIWCNLTLLVSYMVFNPFKMAVEFFKTASKFPILMAHVFIHIFVQIFMSFYGGYMVQLNTASFLYGF